MKLNKYKVSIYTLNIYTQISNNYIYIQYIQYYIYNQRNIMYTSKCNIQYQSIPCVSLTASMACVCVSNGSYPPWPTWG